MIPSVEVFRLHSGYVGDYRTINKYKKLLLHLRVCIVIKELHIQLVGCAQFRKV